MSPLATPAIASESTGPLPRATLVLGGARSGKSRFAEALVAGHAEYSFSNNQDAAGFLFFN